MKILLDEQLDTADNPVQIALNAFGSRHRGKFVSLRSEAPGLEDPDIPGYCRSNGIAALISANVKDFGAKLLLYEALLEAGISVVVLRPGKMTLTPENQAAILLPRAERIGNLVAQAVQAKQPVLLKLTPSELTYRSLDDIRREITGRVMP